MGNSSGSMFYMFLGVIIIYLVGVSIYTLIERITKRK